MNRSADLDWQDDALCIEVGPEPFFPDDRSGQAVSDVKLARALCNRCEVQTECLTWALTLPDHIDRSGVLAGTTPGQRRRMRHRQREVAA